MICKSYCLQFDTILEYHVKNELKSIHELNDMIITLQNTTSAAVKLIQSEIESDIESKLREEDKAEKGILAKPIIP